MTYNLKNYTGEHFLKPDDVHNEPLQQRIAGLREGKFGKLEAVFESGDILSINATNMNILVRAYGESSDDLVGKDIELFLGKIKSAGADNDAVLVRPSRHQLGKRNRRSRASRTTTTKSHFSWSGCYAARRTSFRCSTQASRCRHAGVSVFIR
jgi:hypothetical protein